jgi:hypothetical protein
VTGAKKKQPFNPQVGGGVVVALVVGVVVVVGEVVAVNVAVVVGEVVGVVIEQSINVPSRNESTMALRISTSSLHPSSDFTMTNPLRSQVRVVAAVELREYLYTIASLMASIIMAQCGIPGFFLAGANRKRPAYIIVLVQVVKGGGGADIRSWTRSVTTREVSYRCL